MVNNEYGAEGNTISVSRNQTTDPTDLMTSSRVLVSSETPSIEFWRVERGRVPSNRVFSLVCGCSILLITGLLAVIGLGPF